MKKLNPTKGLTIVILGLIGIGWLVAGCASTAQVSSIQETADQALEQANPAMEETKQAASDRRNQCGSPESRNCRGSCRAGR